MPIAERPKPASPLFLMFAPERPGVYALFDNNELIYYGSTDNLRKRIKEHKDGKSGKCTQTATHYATEQCTDYTWRERELLREFQEQHGKLPRCNEVMP